MRSFKKSSTLLLFAYTCDAQEHTLPSSANVNLDDERRSRSLLLNLPDCSNPDNQEMAHCICRNPFKIGKQICKKWFEEIAVKSKNTIFSGIETRIIGGDFVSNGDYPWFAKAVRGSSSAGCGGALISPQFVLTAAHCVGNFNGFEIGAVCHDENGFPNGNCGQFSQVITSSKIITHPNYNDRTLNNDFALVRLSSPATATPVTMDMNGLSETYTSRNKLWPIGFGNTATSGESYPTRLNHVEVSYVPANTCDSMYRGRITSNMMCAADPNEDSCQGDSGGPLYDKANGVLVGVVSWGYDCADQKFPGVYSRISSKWTWIRHTICSDSGSVKPDFCSDFTCKDTPGWYDRDGPTFDCEWYSDPTAAINRCEEYGNYFGNFGQKATKACCACAPYSTSFDPCIDEPNWHDADGSSFDCGWYAKPNPDFDKCEEYGKFFKNFGKTAVEACCACGVRE